VERDKGAGDREKKGQEVYGRREKRRWEAGEKGKKIGNVAQYFGIENPIQSNLLVERDNVVLTSSFEQPVANQ